MDLLFTGTGAADYQTVFTCACENCTAIRTRGARNVRHYASLFIDGWLLVDCGPTVPWRLAELDLHPSVVGALVITHSHDDHLDPSAVETLLRARPAGRRPLPVYCNEASAAVLEDVVGLEVRVVAPLEEVLVRDLALMPVAANHICQQEETLNWLIEGDGRRVLYATDTAWPLDRTWTALSKLSLDGVVAEATFGLMKENDHPDLFTHHLNWPGFLRLRDEMIERGIATALTPFAATHISQHLVPVHDELSKLATPPVVVAYDGMCLKV